MQPSVRQGDLTDLEATVLWLCHRRYKQYGFPHPSDVRAVSRDMLAGMRVTHVDHSERFDFEAARLNVGDVHWITADGIEGEGGLQFDVDVEDRKLRRLTFLEIGGSTWTGNEGGWKLEVDGVTFDAVPFPLVSSKPDEAR